MKVFFIYLFGKSYYLSKNFFGETEFPQIFSSTVVTIIGMATLSNSIDLICYSINPEIVNVYTGYYKYIALALLLFNVWFFEVKNRYQAVVELYDQLSKKRKKFLGIFSIVYSIVLLILFISIGEWMRDFNLS